MFNYESTEGYTYTGNGLWVSGFFNYMVVGAVSATIDDSRPQEDKPCYLAVMANRSQMQVVLDNAHLFDPAFVNAVSLVVSEYDRIKVELD